MYLETHDLHELGSDKDERRWDTEARKAHSTQETAIFSVLVRIHHHIHLVLT